MNNQKKIAFLDFDGTLIKGQSQKYLIGYFFNKNIIGFFRYFVVLVWFIFFKFLNLKDTRNILEFAVSGISGRDRNFISKLFDDFFYNECKDLIYKRSGELVKFLKQKDFHVVLFSSAVDGLVERASFFLGCDEYISTKLEIKEGLYTGRIDGDVLYGDVKVKTFLDYINKHQINSDRVYAFADHFSDLNLLLKVGHPIPTNPSPKLWKYANKKNWPMLYLDNNESFQYFESNIVSE